MAKPGWPIDPNTGERDDSVAAWKEFGIMDAEIMGILIVDKKTLEAVILNDYGDPELVVIHLPEGWWLVPRDPAEIDG